MLAQDSYAQPEERVLLSAGTGVGYYVENLLSALILGPLMFVLVTVFVGFLRAGLTFTASIGGTSPSFRWLSSFYALIPALSAVLMVAGVVYLVLRAAAVKYVLTSTRLLTSSGLFTHTAATVSLDRIQDVRLHRPFLGLLFGYGFVMVETAGTFGQVTLRYVSKPAVWARAIDEAARALRAQPHPVVLGSPASQPLLPGSDLLNP